MSTRAFFAFTRHAAVSLSRRSSLVTLSGAALAATMANPGVRAAKKTGKMCKKKAKKRCKQDAAACRSTVEVGCNSEPSCVAEAQPCCDTCSANGFLTCFLAIPIG